MVDYMSAYITNYASEVSFPQQVRKIWLPFIQERIVRTFSVKKNSAIRRHRLVPFEIANQVHVVRDRLWRCRASLSHCASIKFSLQSRKWIGIANRSATSAA